MIGALRIVQRNYRVWRKFKIASLVGNLGQPLLFLAAFGIGLSQQVPIMEGYTYLQFIAPGLAASAVMYSASFETTYGSYTRLATQSTFDGILATPITVEELALGEILWGACKGFLSGIIMLLAMPLFGLIPSLWTIALLPVLFLEGILFAAAGLIMTALASNYEFFNYFISLFITPLFLFSGIFFTLTSLPDFTRSILELVPLTPVVTVARMFCHGHITEPWLLKVVAITFLAGTTTWLAAVLLRRRLIK